MDRLRVISLICTFLIVISLSFLASKRDNAKEIKFFGTYKTLTSKKELKSEIALNSELNFISGEINIFPITEGNIYSFTSKYFIPEVRPLVSFQETQATANLVVSIKPFQRLGLASRNYWNLGLDTSIEHKIKISSKFSKHNVNLTSISIKDLQLNAQGGSVNMYFNKLNPVLMDHLYINLGVADCRIYKISNANCKKVEIKGGTGSIILDFSGDQVISSEVFIEGGLSLATLKIPSAINARISFTDKLSTAFKISGFYKISDKVYVCNNFQKDKNILDIKVLLKSGSLKIIQK